MSVFSVISSLSISSFPLSLMGLTHSLYLYHHSSVADATSILNSGIISVVIPRIAVSPSTSELIDSYCFFSGLMKRQWSANPCSQKSSLRCWYNVSVEVNQSAFIFIPSVLFDLFPSLSLFHHARLNLPCHTPFTRYIPGFLSNIIFDLLVI